MERDKGEVREAARGATRGEAVRQRVIDAAERLLRDGKAHFSMRDLAAEAAVSFATPFNQFGSKGAIMHALSDRRIDTMTERFAGARLPQDTQARVMLAIDTAVTVMLEEPEVNRSVMGWIGTTSPAPGRAWSRSTAFWALALADGAGIAEARREQALGCLPRQLALGFRGTLSFWSAGELPDDALGFEARSIGHTLLSAFVAPSS